MTRINLLPWREELRQEKQKQYLTLVALITILAAAIVGLVHVQMDAKINYQKSRNQFLTNEIAKLNQEIQEISELQKVRKSLVERMEIIQSLQGSRPSIVHLFTELVTTVPNGVYLKNLEQDDDTLRIVGEAESNARVSSYMRNLNDSEWLKDPNLDVIQIEDKKVTRISSFILSVKQTSPQEAEAQDKLGGE